MSAALSGGPAVLPYLFLSQGGPPASFWGCREGQAQLAGITVQRISPGEGGQGFVGHGLLAGGISPVPVCKDQVKAGAIRSFANAAY